MGSDRKDALYRSESSHKGSLDKAKSILSGQFPNTMVCINHLPTIFLYLISLNTPSRPLLFSTSFWLVRTYAAPFAGEVSNLASGVQAVDPP